MIGFASSLVGEVLTGKGAIAQFGYEMFNDELSNGQIDALLLSVIVFNLITAILRQRVPEKKWVQDPRKSLYGFLLVE